MLAKCQEIYGPALMVGVLFAMGAFLLGVLIMAGCEVQTTIERKPAGTVTESDVPATAKVLLVQADDGTRCMLAANGQGGYGAITCNWSCKGGE